LAKYQLKGLYQNNGISADYRPNIGFQKYQYRYQWLICLSKYIIKGKISASKIIGIGWTQVGLTLACTQYFSFLGCLEVVVLWLKKQQNKNIRLK
jgi:hypothetical protein